jgi:UDP-N-acetylmuramoyl-tripeptide--D-alanyl-D-alanine ligase
MFTISEIAAAICGRISGTEGGLVSAISTDSRTVKPGELFVPLRGEHFDGHDYIGKVAESGVRTILADDKWLESNQITRAMLPGDMAVIAVNNTLRALGDLAASWRSRFDIPVIGVTGSNGKTTAKEMLAGILELSGEGLKTGGNLNNLIGLPQMLFRLKPEHKWAVLEMGMSEPGEIDRLAEISLPEVGIVLNAFPAHLASMGSIENVARAKGELFMRLPSGGFAVFNADDPLVSALPSPSGVQRISFGFNNADVHVTEIEQLGIDGQCFALQLPGKTVNINLRAFGGHNIYNAMAAAAAADALGVCTELIRDGLENFRPYDKRFQLEELGGVFLVDDSYNANPASMTASLRTLSELKKSRRAFVVLGAMLELGGNEADLHFDLGLQAARVADRLYLYGDLTLHTAKGALDAGMPANRIIHAQSHDEIAADILSRVQQGDFVLVKGSRGMKMEKVAEKIRNSQQG